MTDTTDRHEVARLRDPVGTVREIREGYPGAIIVKSVLGWVFLGHESHRGSGQLRMLFDHELLPSVVIGTVPGMGDDDDRQ